MTDAGLRARADLTVLATALVYHNPQGSDELYVIDPPLRFRDDPAHPLKQALYGLCGSASQTPDSLHKSGSPPRRPELRNM